MNNRLALYIKNIFGERAMLLLVVKNSVNVDVGWPYLQRNSHISTPYWAAGKLRRYATHSRNVIILLRMTISEDFTVNSVYVVLAWFRRLLDDSSEYSVKALLLAHYTIVWMILSRWQTALELWQQHRWIVVVAGCSVSFEAIVLVNWGCLVVISIETRLGLVVTYTFSKLSKLNPNVFIEWRRLLTILLLRMRGGRGQLRVLIPCGSGHVDIELFLFSFVWIDWINVNYSIHVRWTLLNRGGLLLLLHDCIAIWGSILGCKHWLLDLYLGLLRGSLWFNNNIFT